MASTSSLSLLLVAAALLVAGASAISPEGHFGRVTKLTEDNFESEIQSSIDAGKTVFVRWIASSG